MQSAIRINPFQYLFFRSHRTTSLLNFLWSHEKVLSPFHRSMGFAGGLPRGAFRSGHIRREINGAIPRFLSSRLSSLESYPLSPCRACGTLFGLPGFPVRTSTASNKGNTCALSLSAAPVEIIDNGLPSPSVKVCRVTPLPLKPCSTPSPPPFPAEKEPSTEPRSQSIRPAFWALPNRRALTQIPLFATYYSIKQGVNPIRHYTSFRSFWVRQWFWLPASSNTLPPTFDKFLDVHPPVFQLYEH
jgi:hypothetical protein